MNHTKSGIENAHEIPLKCLHQEIQDEIAWWTRNNTLVAQEMYMVACNAYYMFIYVTGIDGLEHRIDVHL